jgi:glycine/serine hydroxymethyltransferase
MANYSTEYKKYIEQVVINMKVFVEEMKKLKAEIEILKQKI